MYSAADLVLKYFAYYFTASNGKGHGIHSPFVFDFISKVLNDKKEYEAYKKAESLRQKLLQDERILKIDDLGAGSSSGMSSKRSVSSIAKNVVKKKKYGQLLYRMIKFYHPKTIVELGTSLGVTTSYLSLAAPAAKIFTLEGSGEVLKIAKENFEDLSLKNIHAVEGNFEYTLPATLYQLPVIDFCFVDGNHRREPTQNYFHWLLPKVHSDSILIFDDIHWSKEMEEAWEHIKDHLAVRCSIDLFFMGIIFFRQEFKQKQHFKIRW